MKIALTVLIVALTAGLLGGCEFCRKKKSEVPPTSGGSMGSGGVSSGAERDAAEAGGDGVEMQGRASTWDTEYARFVEWYMGATAAKVEAPPDVDAE